MEKHSSSLIYTGTILPAVLGALASILFVALVTWAATTINNNVNTGGTLTVSGDSTLTGTTTSAGGIYASSTVFSDGIFTNTRNAVLGAASGTPTVTGLNVTGSGYFTEGFGIGYATTGTGNLLVNNLLAVNNLLDVRGAGTSTFTGRIGLVGSSTPYFEVGIAGDVAIGGALSTSTLSVESTTSQRGGCIELRGANGEWIAMFPGSAATTSGNVGIVSVGGRGLVVVTGRCQQGTD